MMWYVDTSAFVKLVVYEAGSYARVAWTQVQHTDGEGLWSSDLLRTEALRGARRLGSAELARTRAVLDAFALVELSRDTFVRAGELEPAIMRSLDALHLAAALELGDDLDGIVTYDDHMCDAARSIGIAVLQPGIEADEPSGHRATDTSARAPNEDAGDAAGAGDDPSSSDTTSTAGASDVGGE